MCCGQGDDLTTRPFEHFTLDVENKDALQNQIADNENDHILLKDHDFLVKMSIAQMGNAQNKMNISDKIGEWG